MLMSINEVTLRRTGLVLGWVTVARINISLCNQPPMWTQPGHPFVGRRSEYRRKPGSIQAQHAMYYPVSVVSRCKLTWLQGYKKTDSCLGKDFPFLLLYNANFKIINIRYHTLPSSCLAVHDHIGLQIFHQDKFLQKLSWPVFYNGTDRRQRNIRMHPYTHIHSFIALCIEYLHKATVTSKL